MLRPVQVAPFVNIPEAVPKKPFSILLHAQYRGFAPIVVGPIRC